MEGKKLAMSTCCPSTPTPVESAVRCGRSPVFFSWSRNGSPIQSLKMYRGRSAPTSIFHLRFRAVLHWNSAKAALIVNSMAFTNGPSPTTFDIWLRRYPIQPSADDVDLAKSRNLADSPHGRIWRSAALRRCAKPAPVNTKEATLVIESQQIRYVSKRQIASVQVLLRKFTTSVV
jgi:hypothetical protein